ncbi:MAG: potassium channel family protein [Candidatus Saccharibacteria bacterium]
MQNESRLRLRTAFAFLFFVVAIGISGLMIIEKWSLLDAAWVTIVSLLTIGYGDIVPHSPAGRIFMLFLVTAGVGVVTYTLGTIFTNVVETQIARIMERTDMKDHIASLNNHIIVCGAGRVGASVTEILVNEKVPFVMVDADEELINGLVAEGVLAFHGDATKDEVLIQAGVMRARGVISALSEDAYNVFVTLTVKALNPSLTVVARAERGETIEKLKRAGADKVIAPAQLGGQRMATAILKPVSVDLVDTLFTRSNIQVQLEELVITSDSPLCGRELRQIFVRDDSNIIVVAIIRMDEVIMNPTAREPVMEGDVLIVLGARSDLEKLEKLTPA